jgi:lipopolysaccharide biosynthesis glycosyltransferase
MTLIPIAEALELREPQLDHPNFTGALCFVLNAKYLTPFKVLCHSMIATSSFVDRPILIISDEAEVFEDPFVKRVADIKRMVTAEDKAAFQAVLATKVKDTYRLEWIAKYTFLKWLMYDDYGIDSMLYIDTDMVLTRNLHDFLDDAEGSDFICCPMFPLTEAMDQIMEDERLDEIAVPFATKDRYARFVYSFVTGQYDTGNSRVNSGIQYVGPNLLTSDFRDKLIDLASAKPYPNEQSVLTDYFRKNPERTLTFVSPSYNFKTAFLDRVGINQGLTMLPLITNLHYIGAAKPWLKLPQPKTGISHLLWWKVAYEVARRSGTYHVPKTDWAPADDYDPEAPVSFS